MERTHYWTYPTPSKLDPRWEEALEICVAICASCAPGRHAAGERVRPRRLHRQRRRRPGPRGLRHRHQPGRAAPADQRRKADGFDNPRWDFCKTARKPYDIVVTACLAVLGEHGLAITSDGDEQDWRRASRSPPARSTTGRSETPWRCAAAAARCASPSPATACAAGSATSTDRKSHEALHRLPPVLQHEGEEAEQHSELRWGEIAHGSERAGLVGLDSP